MNARIAHLKDQMSVLRYGVLLVFAIALGACHHTSTVPATIDWRTSPLDLNLRGMNGKSYMFRCPAGKPVPESVTGSGPYTDASSICAAAAHTGAIDAQRGGTAMIRILPGQSHYEGSVRNFIRSDSYAPAWGGSFAVLPVAGPGRSKRIRSG